MEQEKQAEEIRILHEALDNLLRLFVPQHGVEYNAVDDALKALALHYQEIPTTMAIVRAIEARGYGKRENEQS